MCAAEPAALGCQIKTLLLSSCLRPSPPPPALPPTLGQRLPGTKPPRSAEARSWRNREEEVEEVEEEEEGDSQRETCLGD